VVHVAAKVAELWGVTPVEAAEITTGNVVRLFRLP
jgi:Tat protein secretion system quality control protein TatD with DNase activity